MAGEWRFFATTLLGDGTEEVIVEDLPLADASVENVLSGAGAIRGSLNPEHPALQSVDGSSLLQPWSAAIYAETGGNIVGGGIVQPVGQATGPSLQVEAAGFAHYPYGMPYDGSTYFVEEDALDIFRHIWDHLQSAPGGNLGVVLDPQRSGVLIGDELEEVQFTVEGKEEVFFEAGPFKLAWWMTDNLAERLDELVDTGGFEYREDHAWEAGGTVLRHRIRFGVPRLGRRRQDMHFKSGDNLVQPPTFSPTDYASEIWALGAGEGSAMKIGRAARSGEKRLRRVEVVTDKQLQSHKRAAELAARTLPRRTGKLGTTSIVITDDIIPDLGDEVLLSTDGVGWQGTNDLWVRVLATTRTPGSSHVTCEVERAQ